MYTDLCNFVYSYCCNSVCWLGTLKFLASSVPLGNNFRYENPFIGLL